MDIIAHIYWDEWIAISFGLVYVLLAAIERPSAWIFGIISCAFWAYGTYVHYGLYLNMILNIFYVVFGFYGLYIWLFGGENGTEKAIGEIPWKKHSYFILGGLLLSFILGYLFQSYTAAHNPYLDGFLTIISIIATFLLAYKVPSNWIYWIVADAIYTGLYFYRGAEAYGFLFIINTLIAIYGYMQWLKLNKRPEM